MDLNRKITPSHRAFANDKRRAALDSMGFDDKGSRRRGQSDGCFCRRGHPSVGNVDPRRAPATTIAAGICKILRVTIGCGHVLDSTFPRFRIAARALAWLILRRCEKPVFVGWCEERAAFTVDSKIIIG